MSTHFTYEIDERKLRVKLKELEPAANAEAWQSLEAYTASQTKNNGHSTLKNIQVPINRNVIIPVVFGILIIFFSVLLFNFINIKGADNSTEKSNVTEIKSSDTEVKPEEISPVSPTLKEKTSKESPSETKNNLEKVVTTASLASKSQMSLVSTPIQKPVQPLGQPVLSKTLQTVVKANSTGTTNSIATSSNTVNSEISSNQTTKKKGKRRSAEVIESDSSNDSRPNLGGDERETEVRPN